MNITKENNELVLRLPLVQKGEYTYGGGKYEVPNLVGLVWGDEYSISNLNYLDYKQDLQIGMPIIMFDSREEMEETCENLGIDVWIYRKCARCKEVLSGCFTIDEEGRSVCLEHKNK